MTRFCPNCGSQINDNSTFCPNCGTALGNTNTQAVQNVQPNLNKTENDGSWVLITAGILVGVSILSIILGILAAGVSLPLFIIRILVRISALIVLIVGLIKYPKNKGIKIFFWIYLVLMILLIIATVLMVFLCAGVISSTISGIGELGEGCEGLEELEKMGFIPMLF